MAVNRYLLGGSETPHGWLRCQVMKTDILVIPVILVSGVYDSAVTCHQATDKVQVLHNQVIQLQEALGRVAAKAFVNDC